MVVFTSGIIDISLPVVWWWLWLCLCGVAVVVAGCWCLGWLVVMAGCCGCWGVGAHCWGSEESGGPSLCGEGVWGFGSKSPAVPACVSGSGVVWGCCLRSG
jgi:hypothetical protein